MATVYDQTLFDKPEIEWLDGRPHPKVSPKLTHGVIQLAIAATLREWARGRGLVATEWRFHLPKAGRRITSFVPDVAYVSFERLGTLSNEEREEPPFAPNVAVEVRSRADRPQYIAEKIAVYLEAGSSLVLDVDPARRVIAHDGSGELTFGSDDIFTHVALPGFSLDLAALFAEAQLGVR